MWPSPRAANPVKENHERCARVRVRVDTTLPKLTPCGLRNWSGDNTLFSAREVRRCGGE